jgi:LacI family transcriptional regulator
VIGHHLLIVREPDRHPVAAAHRHDNWPVFALETEPQLTTVDMNLEALGAAAARELFTLIDGVPRHGGVRRHACRLVVRGSSVSPG